MSPQKIYQEAADCRTVLFAILGGSRCALCGSREHLSFDALVNPAPNRQHELCCGVRVAYYLALARNGLAQVLCSRCNTRIQHYRKCRPLI